MREALAQRCTTDVEFEHLMIGMVLAYGALLCLFVATVSAVILWRNRR